MHEKQFTDYFKAVAAKFGFTGVRYDTAKCAIVFPSSSEKADQIPQALRDQPSTFFAFLAGALTVGDKHITLQPSDEGALLQIKTSNTFDPIYFLSKREPL